MLNDIPEILNKQTTINACAKGQHSWFFHHFGRDDVSCEQRSDENSKILE